MITTIIEEHLSSIDQATFQKLMNHLLHLEGYHFIGSPGSVIGKNKTSKGSPDSFFEDGDNYIFCECTTQERLSKGETFFKKLKHDVEHCFDLKSTRIDNSKISKIILAFTEKINPSEHNELKEKIKQYNPQTELVIYSIQEIPFRLVYYPGLADKYIPGVKTTKGTLYTLPDFLKTTEKGLQPSLTNPFAGREDEINQARDFLQSNDILIITGNQGVGKSKLAVHLAQIFESEYNYEPRVIASSPVPLWEDLTTFIMPTNKYIIFFDDANKSLPNLDYLLQFVNNRDKNSTKIIITVRDYVRKDLDKFLFNAIYNEIFIKPFEDKQLIEIINKSLPNNIFLDQLVMERIVSLSKGNSRIALMAVSSILQNNDISILKNVFLLYDQYFQKVKTDISFLEKPDNLRALGLLSFFGVLDRSNVEVNEMLKSHFNVNWNELWETFIELEKAELVDVFYKEAAKMSDQVLATYAFYKTFIDENSASINYSDWLVSFIEKYDTKINKTLIDLINTFGYEELKDRITSLIAEVQNKLNVNTNVIYKFFETFWFYKEVDTLLFVKNWINSLIEEKTELVDIKYTYEVNDFVWAPEYFKLLINFWNHNTPYTKDAIGLGLKLMFRQPSRIPETLKHLKENLTFHRFDFRFGYPRQSILIDLLSSNDFTDREKTISEQLFLSIAPSLLAWDFHQTESKGNGQMVIHNFDLIKTQSLMELRKKILTRLITLFDENEDKVLEAIHKYAWTSRSIDSSVYEDEQLLITDFILNYLDPENFSHCKLVFAYVETLKEHNIQLLNDWNLFLKSDSMLLAKIFSSEFYDEKLTYDEQEQKRKAEIENYISGKDFSFIEGTFGQLDLIYKAAAKTHDSYWIETSLNYLFHIIAETESKFYFRSLELMMLGKYSFDLNYGSIIFYPIRQKLVNLNELYLHLNRFEYKQKQFWKQTFFDAIDPDDIDEFFLQEYIGFIFSVSGRFYMYNPETILKFDKQFNNLKSSLPPSAESHKNVLTYITEILLSKIENSDISFDHEICKKCICHFADNIDLLKQIYYLQRKQDGYYDHNGDEMEAISSVDHNFLIEYLLETTKDISFLEFKFDKLNLSFVWHLPEYVDILDKALEIIIIKAPIYSSWEHQANVLFKGLKFGGTDLEKVYDYINQFIRKNYSSEQHIHIILNVVTYRFKNQILRFLKEFLLLNKDVEFIDHLWLEESGISHGSRVPKIEAEISFLKSIIEMISTFPNPLDYAEHIKIWERKIEWSKKEMQDEMKRDFKGWMD